MYLQRSVPIQPKTSNILPKVCRSAVVPRTTVVAEPHKVWRLRATEARNGEKPSLEAEDAMEWRIKSPQ